MIYNDIIENCKNKKAIVYFDFDGVLVDVNYLKVRNYDEYRPIKTTMTIANKLNAAGITIGIISVCSDSIKRQKKLDWLAKHMPYVKEGNAIIIPTKEIIIPNIGKHQLKAYYIKDKITDYGAVYFIEDTLQNLKDMSKELPSVIGIHVSSLIE
ncbi:MAG: hypothetical protein FWE03_05130 [Firmicutes bacterium]|nr:hypothetical protein [Bacillota bacterium]